MPLWKELGISRWGICYKLEGFLSLPCRDDMDPSHPPRRFGCSDRYTYVPWRREKVCYSHRRLLGEIRKGIHWSEGLGKPGLAWRELSDCTKGAPLGFLTNLPRGGTIGEGERWDWKLSATSTTEPNSSSERRLRKAQRDSDSIVEREGMKPDGRWP